MPGSPQATSVIQPSSGRTPASSRNYARVVPALFSAQNFHVIVPSWFVRGTAGAELEGVRQEVALMTRTAYREALARRALIDVAQAVVAENQERLRIDRARAEAGAIPAAMSERGQNQMLTLVWITVGFLILIVPLIFLQRWAERRTAVA